MPFVKINRDKRGYEYFQLVHIPTRRGRSARPRVLYWYRTPPGVKVGRTPFDETVRRALEDQNPDISFDWEKLASTPMPPPDVDHWRERRRAEKAAKLARRTESEELDQIAPDQVAAPQSGNLEESAAPGTATSEEGPPLEEPEDDTPPTGDVPAVRSGRRRRRGGRRRHARPAGSPPLAGTGPDVPAVETTPDNPPGTPTEAPADEPPPSSDQEL